MSTIHVVAALVTDSAGRVLMVRKRGTTVFMNPGGKPEGGETAVGALRRELSEEIGLDVAPDDLVPLGSYRAPAANEPGYEVRAEVFGLRLASGEHTIGAEIVESRWIDPHDPGETPLAPLFVDQLLPRLPA